VGVSVTEVLVAISTVQPEDMPAVLTAIAGRMAAIALQTPPTPLTSASSGPDRWLTAEQAGAIAGVSRKAVYDWARGQPWAKRPTRRCLRISEKGFRRWLGERVESAMESPTL
jgi:hypothetical protein